MFAVGIGVDDLGGVGKGIVGGVGVGGGVVGGDLHDSMMSAAMAFLLLYRESERRERENIRRSNAASRRSGESEVTCFRDVVAGGCPRPAAEKRNPPNRHNHLWREASRDSAVCSGNP